MKKATKTKPYQATNDSKRALRTGAFFKHKKVFEKFLQRYLSGIFAVLKYKRRKTTERSWFIQRSKLMAKCADCGCMITEARCQFYADFGMGVPTQCTDCAPKVKPLGFMFPEGKTGAGHLVVVDPLDKHLTRRVRTEFTRGPNHCTAG